MKIICMTQIIFMVYFELTEDKMKSKMKNKPFIIMWASIIVFIIGVVVAVNCVAVHFDAVITPYMGVIGGDVVGGSFLEGYDSTDYYKTSSKNADEFHETEVSLCEQIVGEGTVLLKNAGNTLPLDKGKKISLFGGASVNVLTGGTGSGSTISGNAIPLKKVMEDAGFTVNPTLWDFYGNGAAKEYTNGGGAELSGNTDWSLNEAPVSLYASVRSSYSSFPDAGIVVLSRAAGEGADLPRNMQDYGGTLNEHYLEITAAEKALIAEVNANFDKVIVLINASNAMELGFLDDPSLGIDACLQFAGTGSVGLTAVGQIICGDVNPSGRLADTYAYDALGSPAMQNFGDFSLKNTAGTGGQTFIAEAEGVYVGYKYYETRYEDVILGNENIDNFDYADEVQFTFGYGLSYADFEWTGFNMTEADSDGNIKVSVDVTNKSETKGKDVVQLYYQSEYTEYDVANKIEKPAVSLLGFAKTSELVKDQKETVEVIFNLTDICVYDAKGHGTYILDQGDYFFGVGRNAHDALNNILKKKGFDGDYVGNEDLVGARKQAETDEKYYNEHSRGADVKNQLQFADMTGESNPLYDASYNYLSRSNWEGTFSAPYGEPGETKAFNANGKQYEKKGDYTNVLKLAKTVGYEASGNPKALSDYTKPTVGAEQKLELIELKNADFNDGRWETLLDQLTVAQMKKLVSTSGYQTPKVDSINMPNTINSDGPAGINSFIGGASSNLASMSWPCEVTLACTWNVGLALEMGKAVGEESLYSIKSNPTKRDKQVHGWYAPAMNMHRTPFGGRNFEYFSEDGVLGGKIAANEVKGVQAKGMFVFIKHFAFNDQDTNRGGVATFLNEQAAREIFLKPFQICLQMRDNGENAPMGVMTSYNRIGLIWTGGCYNLITNILRKEWDSNCFVLTDYTSGAHMDTDQMLAAGGDAQLATSAKDPKDSSSAATVSLMRNATKRIAYTIVNSNAMNGIGLGTEIVDGLPIYVLLLIIVDGVCGLGVALGVFFIVKRIKKNKIS